MAVYFKCKSCGDEHPSPIGFGDRRSFETSSLMNNGFQCPVTGQMASYDKKDMVWRDSSASPSPSPKPPASKKDSGPGGTPGGRQKGNKHKGR